MKSLLVFFLLLSVIICCVHGMIIWIWLFCFAFQFGTMVRLSFLGSTLQQLEQKMAGYWRGYVDPDYFPVEFYIWQIIPSLVTHYSCHALQSQATCFFFTTDQESVSKTLILTNQTNQGAEGDLFMYDTETTKLVETKHGGFNGQRFHSLLCLGEFCETFDFQPYKTTRNIWNMFQLLWWDRLL